MNAYEMCAQLCAREVEGDWEECVKMRNELGGGLNFQTSPSVMVLEKEKSGSSALTEMSKQYLLTGIGDLKIKMMSLFTQLFQ